MIETSLLQAMHAKSLPLSTLRADLSSKPVGQLKELFMQVARSICPRFSVTPDLRPVVAGVFAWCVKDYAGRLDPDKGLFLWGDIGTGKSTLLEIARAFASLVRIRPDRTQYSFRITNAVEICGHFHSDGYEGIQTYIASRAQAIDELGSETMPTTHYGASENVMQYILQQRYDSRHSSETHATTNLEPTQLADAYGARIYDRAKEMFNFVPMKGRTFRPSIS